jgi:ubiquinone/menaquinone biosynthesis C-methylase UbiE/16S rRNA G966 N2-methylase RsmD
MQKDSKNRIQYFEQWFPTRNGINPIENNLVQLDKNYNNELLSYMALPRRAHMILDEIRNYLPNRNDLNICETCGGIGGMAIEFLDSNILSKLVTFEINPETRKKLTKNIEMYNLMDKNRFTLKKDFSLENFYNLDIDFDILYIDPPWSLFENGKIIFNGVLLENYPKFIHNVRLFIFHVSPECDLEFNYQGYSLNVYKDDKIKVYYLLRDNCNRFSEINHKDLAFKKLLNSHGGNLYNHFITYSTHNPQVCDTEVYKYLRQQYRNTNTIYVNNTDRATYRAKEILDLLNPFGKINSTCKILDVGCGDGSITKQIGSLSKCHISGCDIYVSDKVKSNIDDFKKIDDLNPTLPYKNAEFNIIIALMSLHHVKLLDVLIPEIKRVLKPNGLFLIREHDFLDSIEPLLDIQHGLYSTVWADETDDFCSSYFSTYKQNYKWDSIIELPVKLKTNPKGDYNFYYTIYSNMQISGGKHIESNESNIDLSKKFELMRLNKSPDSQLILKALELVHDFIVKKKLIVAGGMSIDCALRLKNDKLYPDDALPDYDFLSPNHASDAYEVAQILCKNGFPEVDIINATHVTTMRVRVFGVFVADVTYIPNEIFKKIMTLEYKGLNVLHPYYIIMDQYDSLSSPYKNAPREVITQRWEKDVKRLLLLQQHYKFPDYKIPNDIKYNNIKVHEIIFGNPPGGIIVGWAALAYYNSLNPVVEKKYGTKWSKVNCHIPLDYITIMTDDWKLFTDKSSKIKFMNPMISMYRHVELPEYHIIDTMGSKPTILSSDAPYIASLTLIAWYLINRWLYYDQDPIILMGIHNTLDLMNTDKFKLDIYTYGAYNWNEQFIYYIKNFIGNERDKKPSMVKKLTEDCEMPDNLKNYRFNYENSEYFQIDGSETSEFELHFPISIIQIP